MGETAFVTTHRPLAGRPRGVLQRRLSGDHWLEIGLLVGVMAVGLVLRLLLLGDSLFGDENGAFWDIQGHSLGHTIWLLEDHSRELTPPLFFVLTQIATALLGLTPQVMRLVSLLSGVAVIPLTYLLGERTFGRRAGLIGAGVIALSGFAVFYSAQARPYSLETMLVLIATLAVLRGSETGGRAWWALYGVAACAAMYTHVTSVFPLVVLFSWTVIARPQARVSIVVATLVAVAGFAPWLRIVHHETSSPLLATYAAQEPLSVSHVSHDLFVAWFGTYGLPSRLGPGGLSEAFAAAAALLGLGGLAVLRRVSVSSRVLLLCGLAFGGPLLVILYSSARTTIFNPPGIISTLPAFAVLTGGVLTRARRPVGVLAGVCLAVALAHGSLVGLRRANRRLDYQAAARYIHRIAPQGVPVVDLAEITAGPPNSLEVALSLKTRSVLYPVIRVGTPPLAEQTRDPLDSALLPQSGRQVATEAQARARHHQVLLVLPGAPSAASLHQDAAEHLASTPHSPPLVLLVSFLGALPRGTRIFAPQIYPGLNPVAVYRLRLPAR